MTTLALACASQQGIGQDIEGLRELSELVCMDCHWGATGGDSTPASRIDLGAALDDPLEHLDLLTTAFAQVRQGFMPPSDAPGGGFDDEERAEWTTGVRALARGVEGTARPATLRRMTRRQQARTLKSLFGVDVPVERFLPRDASGYGFDTTGDTLFVTPLYYESWYECVDHLVEMLDAPYAEGGFDLRAACLGDDAAANASIASFLRLAFSREATDAEVAGRRALTLGSGSEGWRDVVRATLLSQEFLYRIEGDAASGDGFTRAARLSFFLHGQRPDAALLARAAAGELDRVESLGPVVDAMLDDQRSRSLAEDFAAQWLGTSELRDVTPDIRRYKPFKEGLRTSMGLEVVEFFDDLVRQNRSALECLDSEFVFVDRRLAKHYAMEGIKHGDVRRVARPNALRGGVLGMAGVLTVTSNPLRTSPVKRGQWVLERIFHAPAPPPPPNVGTLPEDDQSEEGISLRERLAVHRANPSCAACHDQMDPYGLALEEFDGIGRVRVPDDKSSDDFAAPVTLPNGVEIAGAAALKQALLADSPRFLEALGSALFTYGVGRPPTLRDLFEIEEAVRACEADGHRVRTLIQGIALSTAMTDRQSPPVEVR